MHGVWIHLTRGCLPRSARLLEEHQVHQPAILRAVAERRPGGVPEPGPQQHQPVEAHRDAHGHFPLAVVVAVALDDVTMHVAAVGIAQCGQLRCIQGHALGGRWRKNSVPPSQCSGALR